MCRYSKLGAQRHRGPAPSYGTLKSWYVKRISDLGDSARRPNRLLRPLDVVRAAPAGARRRGMGSRAPGEVAPPPCDLPGGADPGCPCKPYELVSNLINSVSRKVVSNWL